MLYEIGLFILAIVAHESGHYWAFRQMGMTKLKVGMHPLGLYVECNQWLFLTVKQLIIVDMAGPLAGLLLIMPFSFLHQFGYIDFNEAMLCVIYLSACAGDAVSTIMMVMKDAPFNMTLKDYTTKVYNDDLADYNWEMAEGFTPTPGWLGRQFR